MCLLPRRLWCSRTFASKVDRLALAVTHVDRRDLIGVMELSDSVLIYHAGARRRWKLCLRIYSVPVVMHSGWWSREWLARIAI